MTIFKAMVKFFLPIVMVIFLTQSAYAQSTKVDSLKNIVNSLPADESKINALVELIYELSYGNKKEAVSYANYALELSQKIDYRLGIANINDLLGIIYLDKGSLDSAEYFLLNAMSYYEKNDIQMKMVTSYQKMAQVHSLRNSFEKANEYLQKEVLLAKKVGDAKLIADSYNDQAALFINQGWNILDNENDSINYLSYFEQALPYLDSAIARFKVIEHNKGIALAYGNMSILREEMGDLESALQHIKSATHFFEKMDYKIYMVTAYNQTNRVYLKMNLYDSALYYIEKSLNIAKEIESKFDIRNAYGQFTFLYQKTGQLQKALDYHFLYDDMNNQILAENKQAIIDELEVKYQTEKKQQELIIQEAQNENQRTVIIFVLLASALFLIVAFIYWRKNLKEKEFNRILEQNQAELERKNVQLKDAYQEQNNLMAVVAHDLKAPLNSIAGLSNILEMAGPLNEEQKEISKKTSTVVNNGLELIGDIMNLSKFRSGVVAEYQDHNLGELLETIVDSHRSYSNTKSIEINFHSITGDSMIRTDRNFFTRIFDNLISNAIKFSPKGSRVDVLSEIKDSNLTVCIQDNGPGFTDNDLEDVFKRFKQLSAKPTGSERSTGLGLSIVKTLVEKLKGNINIQTKFGEGSRFVVTLPV